MKLENFYSKQLQDGSFGYFHSMSINSSITTEKFLRRCMFLNVDKTNPYLNKTLNYLQKCLNRDCEIPDRKEKVIQWHNFEDLMFSSWLVIFDDINDKVQTIIDLWVNLIESSIENNQFSFELYKLNYQKQFGKLNRGQRVIDPTNFYVVTLLKNRLKETISKSYYEYIMDKGIFYIYGNNLRKLPDEFDNRWTIYYLYAIKLASSYNTSYLKIVKKWILDHRANDDYWYVKKIKADGNIFPFSDNWKRQEAKLNDIKIFMNDILSL